MLGDSICSLSENAIEELRALSEKIERLVRAELLSGVILIEKEEEIEEGDEHEEYETSYWNNERNGWMGLSNGCFMKRKLRCEGDINYRNYSTDLRFY